VALAAFQVMNCRDICRIDVRFDDKDSPHVLELNPLPGLAPGFSDLPRMAEVARLSYEDLINNILDQALRRNRMRLR